MYESWYNDHYHEMSDAGRWFRGIGLNLLPPGEWEKRPYRVLIVRLSTARDTADSFSHQLLYQIAVSCEGVYADCAWLPPPEDGELFDRDKISWLTGVVTKRPATDFDCIAISNAIVQELINIPTLLKKSSIPLGKRKRLELPDVPLLLLGGANALNTSLLMGDDPAVDAVFVGEDVDLIAEIFTASRVCKTENRDKRELLKRLREIPGVIEPDQPQPTPKLPSSLQLTQQLRNAPVFPGEGNIGSASLQISEGCPCFCTFCAESWNRKPYREMSAEACVEAALAMKTAMGLDRIELYSFNFNMHTGFSRLLWELGGLFASVGLKSQRLDGITEDPELMRLLHAAGKSSITVGIEGISARLRRRLQKSLDDVTIHAGLARILQTPLRELKLFFLATGWEEEEDFNELRQMMAFIAETMRSVNRQPRIIISMTAMVCFPFTPLERENAPLAAVVRHTILQSERIVQAKRFEFRSAASMNDYIVSQILVRAGDQRIRQALNATLETTGFVYYRDITDRFVEVFVEKLSNAGCTIDNLFAGMARENRLPVDLSTSETFLASTSAAAEANVDNGYCLGTVRKAGTCLACGACVDEQERGNIVAQRSPGTIKADRLKAHLVENAKVVDVHIACVLTSDLRGVSHQLIAAAIARSIMAVDPLLARLYRGYGGSLVADRFESDWIHGDDILTLQFQEKACGKLTALCNDELFLQRINASHIGKMTVRRLMMDMPAGNNITLQITVPWTCDPTRYCSAHSLKYTLLRDPPGVQRYQMSKDTLKKRFIADLRLHRSESETTIELTPGERFGYAEFVRSAVALPSEQHFVRVFCSAAIS